MVALSKLNSVKTDRRDRPIKRQEIIKAYVKVLLRFNELDNDTKDYLKKRLSKYKISLDDIIQNNDILIYQLDLENLIKKAQKAGLITGDLTTNQYHEIANSYY